MLMCGVEGCLNVGESEMLLLVQFPLLMMLGKKMNVKILLAQKGVSGQLESYLLN